MAEETIINATEETKDTATDETLSSDKNITDESTSKKETGISQAEYAKLKAALDKATSEAASFKKQLREKKTEEERRQEDELEKRQAMENELATLKRDKSISVISRCVSSFTGQNVDTNSIAESVHDAGSIEEAVDILMAEITKAWQAREKQLKIEYGRLSPPAAGSDEPPALTQQQFDSMGYKERSEILSKYPDMYKKFTERRK